MSAIEALGTLSSAPQKINRHARVVFELDDGSEIVVRITPEGDALEVRNIGTMEPQSLWFQPESGNTMRLGAL